MPIIPGIILANVSIQPNQIVGRETLEILSIDMKDGGATDYNGTLSGTGSNSFVPTVAVFKCAAASALNGDVEVKIGLSLGGTEILPATTLSDLDAVGEDYVVQFAGHFDSIPDNSTIHVQVSTADTGTSGTMSCRLAGHTI